MFGGSRGRLLPLLCAVALVGAAISGCAGDDGESTANEQGGFSAADEPPEAFVMRTAKLLETTATKQDCAELAEINGRSQVRFPCPPPKDLRKSMARFELVGGEEYGTGAVVDYESGEVKDGAAIVLFVAPDRHWGIARFGVLTEPSTNTSDEDSRDGYDEAVDNYLTAVRERDCKAFAAVAFTESKDEKQVCQTEFAATKDLAKRLKANPSVEPEYNGGNGTYGFYTLETKKPATENMTISVAKSTDKSTVTYLVLNVLPSPTAAAQRHVREQLEKQQQSKKKDNQPKTSPSRKAN